MQQTHENTELRSSSSESKVKIQRVRISEESKARIVQFHERNPHKTLAECVSWAKQELRLTELPSIKSVSKWLQPKEKEIHLSILEDTRPAKRAAKSRRPPKYELLEEKVKKWFDRMQRHQAHITEDAIRIKALEYAKILNMQDFKGSHSWVSHFKKRNGIRVFRLHGQGGSADSTFAAVE